MFLSKINFFAGFVGSKSYERKLFESGKSETKDPTTFDATLVKLEEKFNIKLIDRKKSIKRESAKSDSAKNIPKIDVDTLDDESKPIKVLVRRHRDSALIFFCSLKKIYF